MGKGANFRIAKATAAKFAMEALLEKRARREAGSLNVLD